ncbi:MAG: adenosine deaminase [Chloroflexota bacterium]
MTEIQNTTDLRTQLALLPKIDLHRHLEGSIRLQTLLDTAKAYKMELPAQDLEGLRSYVQITADSPTDSVHFLGKFNLLRRFFFSQEVIQRVTHEAIEDAAADNVKYLELRFTPKALSKLMSFSFDEVVRWVCDAAQQAQQTYNIRVRLIVSMNRHENIRDGERAIQAALANRSRGVVAIDLAGQEVGNSARPFFAMFAAARATGLGITVHAGEWAGPANVRDAILHMGAQRIGHGVQIIENNRIAHLALERGIIFEVCPTSNIQSGAVPAMYSHPLRDMVHLGLKATLNTDDPSVSNITLCDEMQMSIEKLGLTLEEVKHMILTAAQSAFLPDEERIALVAYFTNALLPISQ